jgi:hypothetical protein
MSKIVVYMPEAPEAKPSLDVVEVKLSDQNSILEFLKARKIPLDRVCVKDKKTGRLYVAENASICSVHNPYTGDHIELDVDVQPFIGQLELAKDWLVLHSVFLDESGTLCMETGAECVVNGTKLQAWTAAMMELTFEGEK